MSGASRVFVSVCITGVLPRCSGASCGVARLRLLRQAVGELPPREREIITMRYGLEGRQELTQKEVAQKMGISQSYISRLEKKIMLKLRKELLRQTNCA